jgi:GTP-binding protein
MRDRGPGPAARDRAGASEERSLTDARYIGSFPRADVALTPALPEVALIGRSNVGKSSLLNALASRKIARVSGTPGKTRALNAYVMHGGVGVGAQHAAPLHCAFYVLDLPGYGWARASQSARAAFRRLITQTLDRPRLTGVVWLLDVRRDPSPDDRAMQDLFAAKGTRVLAAVTKGDKLPRGQRAGRERELRETLELDLEQVIMTSARTREGVADLNAAIGALVGEAT